MHSLIHKYRLSHLAVAAAFMIAAPAAMPDFQDDFDNAGDVSSQYSYFNNGTGEGGGVVDTFTATDGSSFALDAANSEVDMSIPDGIGFNFLRLTRSTDTDNHYNLTQPTALTINVLGLDGQGFGAADSMQRPLFFGFAIAGGSPIVVQVQHDQFSNASARIRVQQNETSLPGGAAQVVAVGPNNKDITFNIDADSYSLVMGNTTVIADTAHGLTLDPGVAAIPFFEARHTFNGAATSFSVQSFSGSGTPVPEPGALGLGIMGFALLVCRRRRQD